MMSRRSYIEMVCGNTPKIKCRALIRALRKHEVYGITNNNLSCLGDQ